MTGETPEMFLGCALGCTVPKDHNLDMPKIKVVFPQLQTNQDVWILLGTKV